MKVFFATTNQEKFREVGPVLKRRGIALQRINIEVDEIKSLEIVKTAEKKAVDCFAILKKPVVVEDTGVFFNAFNSFPGTYSKFCVETIGVEATVGLLEGRKTGAEFVTVACFTDGKTTKCFEGRVQGRMVLKPRGKAALKLPYDPYFVPQSSEKTYAEMSPQEKNVCSHRAKAFEKFAEWFSKKYVGK